MMDFWLNFPRALIIGRSMPIMRALHPRVTRSEKCTKEQFLNFPIMWTSGRIIVRLLAHLAMIQIPLGGKLPSLFEVVVIGILIK